MLLILSVIVSAIAALVGIFSKSWNKEKNGINKLSFTGWLSLGLALLGCTISIIIAAKNENQKNSSEVEKKMIKRIAYERLANTSVELITPLITILIQDTNLAASANVYLLPSQFTKELDSKEVLLYLENHPFKSINVTHKLSKWDREVGGFDYNTLIESYGDYAEKLKKIRDEWSSYLETNDLLLLDSIIYHPFYTRIKNLVPIPGNLIQFPFTPSLLGHYKDYIEKITRLLLKVEPKQKKMWEYFPEISEFFSDINYDYKLEKKDVGKNMTLGD